MTVLKFKYVKTESAQPSETIVYFVSFSTRQVLKRVVIKNDKAKKEAA